MSSAPYNFHVDAGADPTLSIVVSDENDALINLTSYTAHLGIKRNHSDSTEIVALNTGGAGIVLGGASGTLDATLTDTQTTLLGAGKYFYYLEITSAGGITTRLLSGIITMNER